MRKRTSRSEKLKLIKLLLLDVDGVMTDGGVYYTESGDEFKRFNIQDGYGIVKLQRAGVNVGILTGKISKLVARRAAELGIQDVFQNLENKLEAYEVIKKKSGLEDSAIAYMGDDEFDLPVLERAGFCASPADAIDAVKRSVDYVCKRRGGEGAVRELIDLILQSKVHGKK